MNESLNNMRKIVKEEIRQRVNEYAEKRKTLKESMSRVPNEIVIDDGKTLKLVKESKSKDDAEDIITEYLDRNYRNEYDEPEIIGFKNYRTKDDKIVVEGVAWTEDKENEFISKDVVDESVNNTFKKENTMKESKAYYEYPKNSGCHVRETTNAFVAIDKNGNTIGQSKTKAGAEALIDEKCSKKQIKEGKEDERVRVYTIFDKIRELSYSHYNAFYTALLLSELTDAEDLPVELIDEVLEYVDNLSNIYDETVVREVDEIVEKYKGKKESLKEDKKESSLSFAIALDDRSSVDNKTIKKKLDELGVDYRKFKGEYFVKDATKGQRDEIKKIGAYIIESLKEGEEDKEKRDANELFGEFLDLIEFQLVKYPETMKKSKPSWEGHEYDGTWGLKDYQGVNLADIEAERFDSAEEIADRLGVYINDYMLQDKEWGEFDSVEGALEKAPDHPLKDLLDLIAHRLGEVDLEKVPHENAGESYKGSECYELSFLDKDGNEVKTLGKPYALNCDKATADKLVATMNRYPGRVGMTHMVERVPYCDAQKYNILSKDDVEEWILDIEAKYKADEMAEESLKKDKKEPIFFGKKVKKDELEEASKKIPYGLKAFQLNEIISHMNDETAYYGSGWLYVWPDGTETVKEAQEYFGEKEEYEELEELFKKIYKRYHRYGLYKVDDKTLAAARKWDKKLGLSEIVDVGRKDAKLAKLDDDYEKKIGEVLAKNGIDEEDFEIQEESDSYDTEHPYKVIYFFENDVAKKAFDVLKGSGEFKTVGKYVEQWPDEGYSPIEVLVSEHEYASADKE